mmetsp:Transcript_30689/g.70886  ORF Transcript_30689/g.70886 Transcript_30689/m.70886 type:complete len:202 (+) Transcript_30689:801-1406(+)
MVLLGFGWGRPMLMRNGALSRPAYISAPPKPAAARPPARFMPIKACMSCVSRQEKIWSPCVPCDTEKTSKLLAVWMEKFAICPLSSWSIFTFSLMMMQSSCARRCIPSDSIEGGCLFACSGCLSFRCSSFSRRACDFRCPRRRQAKGSPKIQQQKQIWKAIAMTTKMPPITWGFPDPCRCRETKSWRSVEFIRWAALPLRL